MKDIKILLVEDYRGDILLTTEAILEGDIVERISVVIDAEEATLFLEEISTNSQKKFLDLIMLDVNIPKKMAMKYLHI
jgi:CheY-like chemotaxis protein